MSLNMIFFPQKLSHNTDYVIKLDKIEKISPLTSNLATIISVQFTSTWITVRQLSRKDVCLIPL